MRPGPAGGLEALPLPGGEPARLWAAAAVLRAAAAAASGVPLGSRGGAVPVLDRWSGEAAPADRPGRFAPHALGWADPPPSDAAVRAAVLADLPVVSGVAACEEAQALVTLVLADLAAVTDGDREAAARAAGRLGSRSRDPVLAQ